MAKLAEYKREKGTDPVKHLVEQCLAALYPTGVYDGPFDVDTVLKGIDALRANRDNLQKLAVEELEKRHAAEAELAQVRAELTQQADSWKARHGAEAYALAELRTKVAALGACFRGLFPEEE